MKRNPRLQIESSPWRCEKLQGVLLTPLLSVALCLIAANATGASFTVNSPADVPDANPGNGVCETAPGNGICTLRAAIQETNALPGADTIILQPNVTYTLIRAGMDDTAVSGDLDITDSVSIVGAGAGSTIIDGNGTVTGERVFQISPCIDNGTPPGTSPTPAPSPCNVTDPNDAKVTKTNMSGLTIQHGRSSNVGGGLVSNGNLTLTNVTITNNSATGINDWGGGIFNSGPLTMTNCTIADNISGTSNAYGGGIFNQGPLTIINSTISGNTTGGPPGFGGGIYNVGSTATVRNSTISGNTAIDGGGIYKTGSPLIVINSTISRNRSTRNGGGIYASAGTTGLFNVTITRNQANSDGSGVGIGGGVAVATGATLTFQNSIIALNENVIDTGDPLDILNNDDCSGTISSSGNNIMHDVDPDHCTVTGPVTIADPNLGSLANNGGPTQTHSLLSGSPAIDAGNPGGCTDNLGAILTGDQRGFRRPNGNGCDVGAVEAVATLLSNISTRGEVGLGDNVMIGGFIVDGVGNKTVLVRAIGPSLSNPPVSLANTLQDPIVSLFNSAGERIVSNDNWADAANAQSIDPSLRPGNNSESAILTSLASGAYTAIVSGANNGTGLGLVEVFDLDAAAPISLSNISTRGLVGTGDSVMIGGFIINGPDSDTVLLRAIGPSLNNPPFNIANALQNPTLSLFNSQGDRIKFNDDWRSDQQAEIVATGRQPSNDAESAILTTLAPGNYTAIVQGVNSTTGVALVEVYGLN